MSSLVHYPLGRRIPDRVHAVSCSLPTLRDVIGYEEKDPAVMERLEGGYPRFVQHPFLRRAAVRLCELRPDWAGREIWLCAGVATAEAVRERLAPVCAGMETFELNPWLAACVLPAGAAPETSLLVRRILQHTGSFASSRAAEDWLVSEGVLSSATREVVFAGGSEGADRYVRSRLAEWFGHGLGPGDVRLCPSGMAATYAAFCAVNAVQAPRGRTRWVQLGWLYLDTIAILQKFTAVPAEDYLKHPDVADLAGLARLLDAHAGRVAGVLAEVPTNPLIQTPPLAELAALCRARGVALVADPSVASPLNVDVLLHADAVVLSLTKYAASEGDVILGAAAVSPASPLASALRTALDRAAAFAAVYPRDVSRLAAQIDAAPALVAAANASVPRVVAFLRSHPRVAGVFWSGHSYSEKNYAAIARSSNAVGAMVSFSLRQGGGFNLARFYDRLRMAKGPSFGLKGSLICPFLYLAHYDLVSTAAGREALLAEGLDPDLLRLSVGEEPAEEIVAALAEALE